MTTIFIVTTIVLVLAAVAAAFWAFKYGYSYRKKFAELKIGSAEEEAQRILDNAVAQADKVAENLKKEKLLEAKEEIHKLRSELDKEIKERKKIPLTKKHR